MENQKNTPLLFKGKSLFNWKLSEEELKYQIDSYKDLKISQSYRGISTIIIIISIALSFLFATIAPERLMISEAMAGAVLYGLIAFFVYRGSKWALITMIILWTIEKGYQIYIGVNPIISLFWWFLFVQYFYFALVVELKKEKLS